MNRGFCLVCFINSINTYFEFFRIILEYDLVLKKIDYLRKKGPNNEITPFSCIKGDVRYSKLRKKKRMIT